MQFLQHLRRDFVLYLICIVLLAATAAVYWQVLDCKFTNFDDNVYVVDNPYVKAGLLQAAVRWAFTATYECTWQPLTWISYMADSEFSGIDASAFHLTNLVLHLANTALLLLVLSAMTHRKWPSAFMAAMFALHPLHVESVAWVAERKDVLSTLFWMLAIIAYLRYLSRPDARRYVFLLAAFAAGLMSKPMVITLPLALLMLDYWPLGRLRPMIEKYGSPVAAWRKLVAEKYPMLVLSITSAFITSYAMYTMPEGTTTVAARELSYPIGVRAANAVYSYAVYIIKTIWPAKLAVFYPHPGYSLPVWQVLASAAFLVVVTVLALLAARRYPYVTVGWLWYVITLVPASGIMQGGRHGMADRFTYIPMIGLSIIVAWGIPDLISWAAANRPWLRRAMLSMSAAGACAILAALGLAARTQVSYWQDSVTLFSHAVSVTRNNAVAHHNLGAALFAMGRNDEAIVQYRKSLRADPSDPKVLNDLGAALCVDGRFREALPQFEKALKAYPKSPLLQLNTGATYMSLGKYDLAVRHLEAAVRLDPTSELARQNLDMARAQRDIGE